MNSLVRNLVFTLNNPTKEEIDGLKKNDKFSFIVFCPERGESGTRHLQGYLELSARTRFNTVKKMLGLQRSYLCPRKGTAMQAAEYARGKNSDGTAKAGSDVDDVFERGEMKKQGSRTDLDVTREAAVDGGMREVTRWCNFQEIRVAERYLTYNEPERDPDGLLEVRWFWGDSGVGKSLQALCEAEAAFPQDVYHKKENSKWWDGYDGHKAVIIDDFRGSWWCLTYMLALLDRYPFRLEVKGGYRQMRAERIYVTSIKHPRECYCHIEEEPAKQLKRRISSVVEVLAVHTAGIKVRWARLRAVRDSSSPAEAVVGGVVPFEEADDEFEDAFERSSQVSAMLGVSRQDGVQ